MGSRGADQPLSSSVQRREGWVNGTLQPPPAAGEDLKPLEIMLVWFLVNLLRWICWEKLWISGAIFCLIKQIRI